MVFKYDPSRLDEYCKKGILASFRLIIFSAFVVLPVLYISISMQGIENALFIILITFIMTIISAGIGMFIGNKKAKKEFVSYQIECNNEIIKITSDMFHKEIKIGQIKKILIDNKNNIYIMTDRINKIRILNYIENIEELKNCLSNISSIEQYKAKYNILQYIPLIFYIALMYISRVGNLQLYLVFAIIVVFTTIYSIIKLILDQIRIRYKIIPFIVYGIILFSVIFGIYNVINYLLK